MTNKEREQVRKAIRCFSADGDDWEGGMIILFKLLGRDFPVPSGPSISVKEILKRCPDKEGER